MTLKHRQFHPWAVPILSGVFVILAVFLVLQGNGVMIGPGQHQNNTDIEIGVWDSTSRVEQSFVALYDNLCRIDFYVESHYPWNSPYLECRLFEIASDEIPAKLPYKFIRDHLTEVRHVRIPAWTMSGHMFNKMVFAPIPDSMNKRYLLSIRSPQLREGGMFILQGTAEQKYYKEGNLFVSGGLQPGQLAFRIMYQQPRLQIIAETISKLSLQKPTILSSRAFYYLLGGGYVVMVLALLWLLGKSYF